MTRTKAFDFLKQSFGIVATIAMMTLATPSEARNYNRGELEQYCLQNALPSYRQLCRSDFLDFGLWCQGFFDGDYCVGAGMDPYLECRSRGNVPETCRIQAAREVEEAASAPPPEPEPEPDPEPGPGPGPRPFPPGHRPDDRPWADLIFESNPANPFRAHIVISEGAVDDGCPAGQRFDARFRWCVSPYGLYSESHWVLINERACPPGQVGSIKTFREYRRNYFGWWIDYGDGVERRVISHHTDQETDETRMEFDCVIPPPPPPEVGQTFDFSANLICNSTDSGYRYDPPGEPQQKICITNSFRNSIISTYRNESTYGRCPERGGFEHWVWAVVEVYSTRGYYCDETRGEVLSMIVEAFDTNHDDGSWDCQSEANRRWKPAGSVLAEMVPGSGRRCRITQVP